MPFLKTKLTVIEIFYSIFTTTCLNFLIFTGYSVESDHNVAGAALRALGSYIQFLPSLKSDYTFIVDVSKAIFSLISHTNR